MLVDFYTSSEGAVFEVAASLNGVAPPTNDIAPYLAGSSTNTSTSSGVTSEPLSGGRRALSGFVGGSPAAAAAVLAGLVGLGLAGGASVLL